MKIADFIEKIKRRLTDKEYFPCVELVEDAGLNCFVFRYNKMELLVSDREISLRSLVMEDRSGMSIYLFYVRVSEEFDDFKEIYEIAKIASEEKKKINAKILEGSI